MTGNQFLDLIMLHEVEHSFGVIHPTSEADAYEKNIWDNCFQMSPAMLVLCLFVAPMLAKAGSYCSLVVDVKDPSGSAASARITVEEESGWKTERWTERRPAEFCGLGIRPVTVAVGDARCNQSVVRSVPLAWRETRRLTIVYDDTPCRGETLPLAACKFLLRFVDTNHDPIPFVSMQVSKPFPESYLADDYGRVFIRLAIGEELVGVGSANGFVPFSADIPCVSGSRHLERVFVLNGVAK